jgi:hypothetical protein
VKENDSLGDGAVNNTDRYYVNCRQVAVT